MDISTLGFGAAFLMGLVFGAGPCTITCLPYLGPVFLAGEGGRSHGLAVLLPFSVGRLLGYSMLGGVAGYAGQAAAKWFEEGPAAVFLGVATVVVGIQMLRSRRNKGACSVKPPVEQIVMMPGKAVPRRRAMPAGLFGLGFGMALNPCVPLASVLAVAAASASPVLGGGLGLAFGMGAVVVPAVVFGFLVAHFASQVRQALGRWHNRLSAGAGTLLIVLGMFTAFGWVQP